MLRALGTSAAALCTILAAAAPAVAQRDAVTDPAGDASTHALDVVHVAVDNRDDEVVATIRFTAAVRGDLVVSLDPRGGRGVRVVSRYRPVAHTSNVVLGRAFTDRHGSGGPVECQGLRVRWSTETPVVRLRLPSTCLAGGDYGAIRYAVLTEDPRGGDDDATPDDGAAGWVARG